MGKKKGTKEVEKKIALAARKEAKQEKSARKRIAKQQGTGVLAEEEDDELDQVLQAYKNQDKAVAAAIGDNDKPLLESIETPFPLPRANATLCDVEGEKRDYFYLFGGEYFDGVSNIFLDDLLRYEVSKKEWKHILTSPRPNARCAHSCVSYKQSLYVFGGELETAEEYHHYRDLWKFDTNTLKWTEINAKNPPSARSGHAAFVWKSYMIIFGGFFEALRETKWYNDICVFNLQTETWMDIPQSRLAAKPEPRSASNVAFFGTDKIIMHGGFSKMKSVNSSTETKVHSDAWILHLSPILQQNPPTWERWISSSKGVNNNTPNNRAGTSSTSYKNRMLVFGGVVDSEEQHHKVDSIFYNSLFALDTERRKWFPLRIKEKASGTGGRRRRKTKGDDDGANKETSEVEEVHNTTEADEDESSSSLEETEDEGDEKSAWNLDMLRTNMFAFIDGDGNVVYEKIEEEEEKKESDPNSVDEEEKEEEKESESEEEEEKEEEEEENESTSVEERKDPEPALNRHVATKPATNTAKVTSSSVMTLNPDTNIPEAVTRKDPLPRINSCLVVIGHTMYLYGGILEVGDREVTLDDMWALDLRKRETWECLWPGTMHKQVWRGAIHDDDDSYISTGRDNGSEDDDDASESEAEKDEKAEASKVKGSSKKDTKKGLRQEIARLNEKYDLEDGDRSPQDSESLADFYSRTSKYWNGKAGENLAGTGVELSNKELKREGFKLAQTRYDELKPVLDKLSELALSFSKADSKRTDKDKAKKKSSRK